MLPRSRVAHPRAGVPCVAVAVAALVLPPAGPAAADPSDQPGGTSGVLDSRALDELQKRRPRCRPGCRRSRREVTAARDALTQAEQAVADAQKVVDDAEGELAGYQDGRGRLRVGAVPGRRRADAAHPAALRRRPRRRAGGDGLPGRRRRARRRGHRRRRDAAAGGAGPAAAGEGGTRPGAGACRTRWRPGSTELEAAAAAVTDELDAALGDVDRQLAQLQKEQVDVNTRTAANWQAYVDQLPRPGVAPPARGQLRDPPAGLPAGLVPVAAAAGERSAEPPSCRASRRRCWCCRPRRCRGERGDERARAAVRARDRRPGVVGLRLAGAVGRTARRASRCPATQADCSPSRRRSTRPTCCPATSSSSATRSRASGTWASRWTRRRCSPPTPGPARSSSARCRPTRCWASAGRAWASGRRWPPPGRRAARCGWSAATPSTRRATTAPGSGAAIPTG